MRLLLACVALLVLAAPAGAETLEASAGDVRAVATYEDTDRGPKAVLLQVFEGDEVVVERAVPDKRYLRPVDVAVRDLEGDDEPEAIFTLYTGGAHCCVQAWIYEGAQVLEHDFGNAGYVLAKIGGELSFVSSDDRFSYRYASYAGSLRPLQVLRFEGTLVDVTREPSVRSRLRRDAKQMKRYYQRAHRRGRDFAEFYTSPLAAFTADMCNLGNCRKGYALAAKAARRGEVERSFLKRLRKDMRKLGYAD